MTQEGVEFITNAHIGVDISLESLQEKYDAVVLCGGASQPRDLPIENRDANGCSFCYGVFISM